VAVRNFFGMHVTSFIGFMGIAEVFADALVNVPMSTPLLLVACC